MRDLDFLFNLNPRSIGRCTQIDYDRDMAFVAVSASNGDRDEIAGEIRAFRYPDGATAEFTLLVRSDTKRRGLGRTLLRKMIAYCETRAIHQLIGQIMTENHAMVNKALRHDGGDASGGEYCRCAPRLAWRARTLHVTQRHSKQPQKKRTCEPANRGSGFQIEPLQQAMEVAAIDASDRAVDVRLPPCSRKRASNFSITDGSFSTFSVSAWRRSTMTRGVFAGTSMPFQKV